MLRHEGHVTRTDETPAVLPVHGVVEHQPGGKPHTRHMELGRWPACLCEDQKAQLAGTHPVGHVPQAIARHHRMADNQPQHAESGQPRRGDTARERLPQLLVVGYEREPVSQGRARHSCRRRRNQPHGGGRAARVVDRRRGIRRGTGNCSARSDGSSSACSSVLHARPSH